MRILLICHADVCSVVQIASHCHCLSKGRSKNGHVGFEVEQNLMQTFYAICMQRIVAVPSEIMEGGRQVFFPGVVHRAFHFGVDVGGGLLHC